MSKKCEKSWIIHGLLTINLTFCWRELIMMILIILLMIFELSMVVHARRMAYAREKENAFHFEILQITPDANDLIPAGDALLASGFATLTSNGWGYDFCKNLMCKGQVFHSTAVKIPSNTEISSFSTKFTFSMTKSRISDTTGDGFIFFLGKYPKFAKGESNGRFGLFTNNSVTVENESENSFFGIEFDTMMNVDLHDQDDNHLGVDINSAVSEQVAQANAVDVLLNDGKKIISWIDWNKTQNLVEVRICYDTGSVLKPTEPLLSYTYSLDYSGWDEFWIGFSSSSNLGFEQRHLIHNWAFKANFEAPPAPGPQKEPNGIKTYWKKLIASVVGVVIPVLVTWYFIVKFTKCGKWQHATCMKLLPSKYHHIKGKMLKKKEGSVDDDDEKSISTIVANVNDHDDDEDQKDDEDKKVEEGEDVRNNDKSFSPPLSSSTPRPQGKMLHLSTKSKIKHSHSTPLKLMHASTLQSKMKHPYLSPTSVHPSPPQSKMNISHSSISKSTHSSSSSMVFKDSFKNQDEPTRPKEKQNSSTT